MVVEPLAVAFSWGRGYQQYRQEHKLGIIGPLPESVAGLECVGKRDETADVEIVGWYSHPAVHGIKGIAVLLYVRRYHEDWFAELHRLANRLKTSSTGVCLADSHLTEECHVVNLMEAECGVYHGLFVCSLLVPKESKWDGRIVLVPWHDISSSIVFTFGCKGIMSLLHIVDKGV